MKKLLFGAGLLICFVWNITAQNTNTSLPGWITRPLSLTDCLNIALQQNATILKAGNDLDASIWRGRANARRRPAPGSGHRPIQGHRSARD
jgi:hypothetical protein